MLEKRIAFTGDAPQSSAAQERIEFGREDYALAAYKRRAGRVSRNRPMYLETLQYVFQVDGERQQLLLARRGGLGGGDGGAVQRTAARRTTQGQAAAGCKMAAPNEEGHNVSVVSDSSGTRKPASGRCLDAGWHLAYG